MEDYKRSSHTVWDCKYHSDTHHTLFFRLFAAPLPLLPQALLLQKGMAGF